MELVSRDEIRTLAEAPEGICVSIFLPTEKAGKETQQNAIRFKNLLRRAEESLRQQDLMKSLEIKSFLKPAEDLIANTLFWLHQSEGLALFLSRHVFRYFRVPMPFEELQVVGRRFHVKPLLRLLTGEGRFYVLSLDRKHVQLFQGTRFHISEVGLEDTPTSFEEVVGHEATDQGIRWHGGTPTGRGNRSSQSYGSGGGEEEVKLAIRKFFSLVERGVSRTLAGQEAPLILAGVEYLLPIYRGVNAYPHLVSGELRCNAADLTPDDLHQRGWAIVEPLFVQEQRDAAARYRELAGTGRTSDRVEEIVPAAGDGRIEVLFVARGVQRWGAYNPESRAVALQDAAGNGAQDLLDLASIETLRHGGRVYLVDPQGIPAVGAPAAALFRY